MKKLLFFIYVLPLLVFSQNSIGVDSSISVNINETFEIPISLNSDGDFIAFQTDIRNTNNQCFMDKMFYFFMPSITCKREYGQ